MKKIKKIVIGFENCEVVELSPKMFLGLEITGIKKEYLVNCYQYENGEVCEYLHCEFFRITINKLGLETKLDHSDKLRDRLKLNDIVFVELVFSNKKTENIYVLWGDEDFSNTRERHRIVKEDLRITIT